MNDRDEARGLLPLRRAAKRAGVPVKWLKEQAEAGIVPCLRAGNRWLFLPDAVAESIERMAKASILLVSSPLASETVHRLIDGCDGWTIHCPDELRALGLPDAAVNELSQYHETNSGSPGGTIFVEGLAVERLRGIYSLDLLRWIARNVGADLSGVTAWGRGSQADQLKKAIRACISEPSSPLASERGDVC